MVKKVDRMRLSLCVYAERRTQMQANAWNLIMIHAGSFFVLSLAMHVFMLDAAAIAHNATVFTQSKKFKI